MHFRNLIVLVSYVALVQGTEKTTSEDDKKQGTSSYVNCEDDKKQFPCFISAENGEIKFYKLESVRKETERQPVEVDLAD